MTASRVAGIPAEPDRYFWDYEPGTLSWDRDRRTVAWRLVEAGGWEATRWLLDRVSRADLRELLTEREGRGLDPKRLRFWELILDLPRERVDGWIAARRSEPWASRPAG